MKSDTPYAMHRFEKRLYFYITAAWFLYLVLRAIFVPLVNDEGYSYFQYIQPGLVWPGHAFPDANNHILNTLLAMYAVKIFGVSAFVIRLPNLLAALMFAKILYNFSTLFTSKTLRWGFIFSFLGSAYFFEFFALCRGYGLSMAFLMGTLWFFQQFIKSGKLRYFLVSLIYILLGVAANLNLLLTAILLIVFAGVYFFTHTELKWKNSDIYTFLILCVAGGFVLNYFAGYGFALKNQGRIYIGAENGFLFGSIIPFVKVIFFGLRQFFILMIVGLLSLAILTSIFNLVVKKFKSLYTPAYISLIFLLGNCAALLLMIKFLHIKSPQDRAILHFFPFIIIYLFFIADSHRMLLAKLMQPFYLLIPLYFLCITIPGLNVSKSYFFRYQSFPKAFSEYLHGINNNSGYPVITSANIFMNPGYMFNNLIHGGVDANLYSRDYPVDYSDFQVFDTINYPSWNKTLKVVLNDKSTGSSLLKRKDPPEYKYMTGRTGITSNGMSHEKGLEFGTFTTDSMLGHPVYVGFDVVLTTEFNPLNFGLVIDVYDSAGIKHFCYEILNLNEFHATYNHTRLRTGVLLPPMPTDAAFIKIYLLNDLMQAFTLENSKCELFSLIEKH